MKEKNYRKKTVVGILLDVGVLAPVAKLQIFATKTSFITIAHFYDKKLSCLLLHENRHWQPCVTSSTLAVGDFITTLSRLCPKIILVTKNKDFVKGGRGRGKSLYEFVHKMVFSFKRWLPLKIFDHDFFFIFTIYHSNITKKFR